MDKCNEMLKMLGGPYRTLAKVRIKKNQSINISHFFSHTKVINKISKKVFLKKQKNKSNKQTKTK